ncbi:ferric reductase transmembrane component 5 [Colletotrichum sojae]|uniref:ferric-chelate reductase (NADPH) n=1 Tax=Colletotrichum sojae TaxID=2175907 RepID=A0A8H6IRD9_9PEZI|nr:ferric reductase transmembrane component 5 [Colletotrichum sojae]
MIEPRAAKKPKPPNARQLMNEWNLKVYAGVIAAVIAVFILYHWVRILNRRFSSSARTWQRLPGFSYIVKATRVLVRKVPCFPSGGHALWTVAYVGVNIVMCFHHVDSAKTSNFAARFGWMSTANMALCVFFGLKNTPLGVLTGHSYERLNFFHRLAGYAAVLQLVLHAIFYMIYYGNQKRWSVLFEEQNWEGIVAGVALLVLLLGLVRNFGYESFFVSHLLGFFFAVLFTALHRPYWVWKIPVAMLFAAAIWAFDRLVRGSRMLYNLVNNSATIYRLPNNGVRMVIKKPLAGAVPGSHCFVWIPSIRAFQTHPFTIVSNTPAGGLELVFNSYNGFTKAAHDCAGSDVGTSVWASVDGPYGAFPNPSHYDKVVLVAGGTGASFTLGLASSLLQHLESNTGTHVDFIWAVRKRENLEWFGEHIQSLCQHPSGMNMLLHVTREGSKESPTQSQPLTVPKQAAQGVLDDRAPGGLEKEMNAIVKQTKQNDSQDIDSLYDIKYDKLEAEKAICQALETVQPGKRILIAACGPQTLTDLVRTTAARHIASGSSIEIHCETFGW